MERGHGFDAIKEEWFETHPRFDAPVPFLFEEAGLPLSETLTDMFQEGSEHRFQPETQENNRKGSGFLQVGRELASLVNSPYNARKCAITLFANPSLDILLPNLIKRETSDERRARLLALKDEYEKLFHARLEKRLAVARERERVAGRIKQIKDFEERERERAVFYQLEGELSSINSDIRWMGERVWDIARLILQADVIPADLWRLPSERLSELRKQVSALPEGERVLPELMLQLLDPEPEEGKSSEHLPSLKISTETERTGTCTTAEMYFLDFISDAGRGYMAPDVIVGNDGKPVMLFKRAGNRSALTLVPVVLGGTVIPPGSLLALKETDTSRHGVIPLGEIEGALFLRLTTLAIPPEERKNVAGGTYVFQQRNEMPGFATVTLKDAYDRAERYIKVRSPSSGNGGGIDFERLFDSRSS